MVLATDMSCHFQQIKAMKSALQQPEAWVENVTFEPLAVFSTSTQLCAVKSVITDVIKPVGKMRSSALKLLQILQSNKVLILSSLEMCVPMEHDYI